MNLEPEIAISALKFVCGESNQVCRLCFTSTVNQQVNFDDSVSLTRTYFNKTVSFVNMFDDLGIYTEQDLPQVLCKECAQLVIDSYLLQKLCEYSDDKWDQAIKSMSKTLEQSEQINPATKTAFFMMEKEDTIIFTTKKSDSTKSKANALKRIKKIFTNKTKYAQRKNRTRLVCEECGDFFASKIHLKKHRRSHGSKGDNTFVPCTQCAKVFPSKLQLNDHAERVHFPKNIQCTKCAKMFSTEKMLKHHDKIYHIAAICKLCFKQCPSKLALRAHLEKHEVRKCGLCYKSFNNKHSLKLHLKICGNNDSKLPVFFCDYCKKGYARKNSLRTHIKIDHGYGQLLSCPWCSKKFDASSRLRNHVVKHTKEKNFHCDQCGGRFVTQAALKYHTRLHTGERPFPCDQCEETFLSASRRMDHKRRKHLAPTKECRFCHMKFVTKYTLQKHEERHYNPQSKLYVGFDTVRKPTETPIVMMFE